MGRSFKSLLLLLSLIILTIFIIQNGQLITVYLLNRPLNFALPLGIWVLIFVVAGLITNGIIKLLNPVEFISVTNNYNYTNSDQDNNYNQKNQELEEDEEWNIEEPPMEATPIKDRYYIPIQETVTQEELEKQREQEFEKKESTTPHPEQIYEEKKSVTPPVSSPEKRRKRRSQTTKKDEVYDANYRVITPAYRQKPQESQESWNDEDFDF